MEEKTPEKIASIYAAASSSVTLINEDANYSAFKSRTSRPETEDEWKDLIKRNVEHLEIIKAFKKLDGTTSIWTSEDFTAIDAAIVAGKKLY